MFKNKTVSVYFVCQNNEVELEQISKLIPSFVDEVIIVCNQSKDNSYKKSIQLSFKTFRDDRLQDGFGSGFAHMTALENASTDIIVSGNINNLKTLKYLTQLLDYFIENGSHVISFNRRQVSKSNLIQSLLNTIITFETLALYGVRIEDMLSDIWAVDSTIVRQLELTVGDNNIISQIKINAAMHPNIHYEELKMLPNSPNISIEMSKISIRSQLRKIYWIARNFFDNQIEIIR